MGEGDAVVGDGDARKERFPHAGAYQRGGGDACAAMDDEPVRGEIFREVISRRYFDAETTGLAGSGLFVKGGDSLPVSRCLAGSGLFVKGGDSLPVSRCPAGGGLLVKGRKSLSVSRCPGG